MKDDGMDFTDTIKIIPPLPRDAHPLKASTVKRRCKQCGLPLNSYNKTSFCCRHSWMQVSAMEYDARNQAELN